MRKLFIAILGILLLAGSVSADWYYNPFTSRLDYYQGASPIFTSPLTINDADADSAMILNYDVDDVAEIDLGSQTYHNYIQSTQAEGLAGADFRIGLDEALRTVIICDSGDIGTDFGLAASTDSRLLIYNAAGSQYCSLVYNLTQFSTDYNIRGAATAGFQLSADLAAGDVFTFQQSAAGVDLTDTNAEQAWIKGEATIAQTGTATWYGDWIDVTVTTEGDGSTGFGNAYLVRSEAGTEKFSVKPESDTLGASIDLGGIVMDTYTADVIDDGLFDLPSNNDGGWGFVQAGDGEEYAQFSYTSAGAVTLIANSANVANSDSDTDLCIFDNGAVPAVKNRLGATKTIKIIIYYIPD